MLFPREYPLIRFTIFSKNLHRRLGFKYASVDIQRILIPDITGSIGDENQFVIFKPISHCFRETKGFDIKASFASRPESRLIR